VSDEIAGATIIVTYTSKDASDAVKPISEKYGVPIHVYRCPGEESKVVDEVVEKASKEVGEIDVVVVNAGVSMWKDHIDCTDGKSSVPLICPFLLMKQRT